jgi:hypothetical protein
MNILKLIYTVFLGMIIAVFVGVGIETFYSSPKAPEYPLVLEEANNSGGKNLTPAQQTAEKRFNQESREYEKVLKPYSRNVSIIALIVSVVALAISLLFERKIQMIADGVMLGGLFTLVYSMIRAGESGDTKYIFSVVSVGLIVTLYLGYHRFIKGDARPVSRKGM